MARIRVEPEDFRVEEEPLYAPSGEGGHTFVRIEKRLRTTEAVARDLARAAGARPGDVGYAGRKDRVAVTVQWFSVPDLEPEEALGLELPGAQVLEAARHPHKLRTGHLAANRFALCVREVDDAGFARAEETLERALRDGLPNRYGRQRFGSRGDNAERARRFCAGELEVRDRREARFLVSAWQAELFNTALAERPEPLGRLEAGDLAVLHTSGGLFQVEDPVAEQPRSDAFEISPTGPVFGRRMRWPGGAVAERERELLRRAGLEPDGLDFGGVRARGTRRALRMRPEQARLERVGGDAQLAFRLVPGGYATVVVEELFGAVEEGPPP